jgi:hypothetical protein
MPPLLMPGPLLGPLGYARGGARAPLSRYSLALDGSDDRVDVPDSALWNGSTFSWSCWFNPGSLGGNETLLMKGTYASSWSYAFQTLAGGDGLRFFVTDSPADTGGNVGDTAAGVLTADAWHHLLLVFTGAGADNAARLRCYLNGTQRTLSFQGTIPASLTDSAGALCFGEFVGLGRRLAGKLDDVALFAADRSADAAGLYAGTTDPATLAPAGLWRFEDQADPTADGSGNGNPGDLVNGPTFSPDVPAALQ